MSNKENKVSVEDENAVLKMRLQVCLDEILSLTEEKLMLKVEVTQLKIQLEQSMQSAKV